MSGIQKNQVWIGRVRLKQYVVALCAIALCACQDMDAFLANQQSLEAYQLPGNSIDVKRLEEVSFKSGEVNLYGYWVQAKPSVSDATTVIYCHGNKHHLDEYWERVTYLEQLDVNVLIFDYQSFGKSEGIFSEENLLADAEAALAFVQQREDVNTDKIALYGYSLGNVPCIHLASRTGFQPLWLISEAPFAAVDSLVQGSLSLPLPSGWLTTGTFNNLANISQINTPYLLFHGGKDDFVRYQDNGQPLFEAAPEPKSLQLVVEANHNDIPEVLGVDHYINLMREFVAP
jgi:fermentation-respiration switch protein FrsA (DUF1100 family)